MERVKRILKENPFIYFAVRQAKLFMFTPSLKNSLLKDHMFWEKVKSDLHKQKKVKRVLLASSIGSNFASTILEALLAIGLTLRGADVDVLFCDKLLPACLECWIGYFKDVEAFIEKGPGRLCVNCFESALRLYDNTDIRILRYSDFLSQQDLTEVDRICYQLDSEADMASFVLNNCKIGEHSLAGTLRFLARGNLERQNWERKVLKRYLRAGLMTYYVINNLLKSNHYDVVVAQHGIYVPQGIIGEVCRNLDIHVVNWNPGYRKGTFIFSHGDTYHRTMITEQAERWRNISWDSLKEKKLMSYLKSRWTGKNDWIWFHEKPIFDWPKIKKELGLVDNKPIIGLLTSVIWDARLHYESNVFNDIVEWVIETIKYFKHREDLQLLIRIHPAEIRGTLPSRQPMYDEIKKAFSELPKNVFVIPPESRISSYIAMLNCNSVIIYNTKMGIEISAMGVPVIVVGEAWIRGKGFAIDILDRQHYMEVLDSLPVESPMKEEKLFLAKKYAYHFFFRRLIPISYLEKFIGNPPYKIKPVELKDLFVNKDKGFDIICRGILDGTPFIYD